MNQVEPFTEFLARTANARPEQYSDLIRAAAERGGLPVEKVTAEFERMKSYIVGHYEGVRPAHSFLNAAGQPVDCVPFEQQPTARAARAAGYPTDVSPPTPAAIRGISPPNDAGPLSASRSGSSPPPEARSPASPSSSASAQPSQCPPGTVPLLRVTLDRLIPLGTLDNFFHKTVGLPEGRTANGEAR
jgi:hypothetical protein